MAVIKGGPEVEVVNVLMPHSEQLGTLIYCS